MAFISFDPCRTLDHCTTTLGTEAGNNDILLAITKKHVRYDLIGWYKIDLHVLTAWQD